MKNKIYLFSAFLAVATLIAGCNNEDTPTPPPSISFVGTTGSQQVSAGDSITVEFFVEEGGKHLRELVITRNNENYEGFNNGDPLMINGDEHSGSVRLAAPETSGDNYQYIFTATDIDGRTGSNVFTVTAQ